MEKITLEMIDKFIEETGYDYHEARAYLLAAEGDLELAIEAALAKDGPYARDTLDSFVEQAKDLVRKGSLVRLIVKKDDKLVLNIPLGLGIVGALVATKFSAAALGISLLTGHEIILEKKDGDLINVNDYLDQSIKKAKDSGSDIEEVLKKGFQDTKEFAKDVKDNLEDRVQGLKEEGKVVYEYVEEEVEESLEEIKEEAEDLKEELGEDLDQAEEVLEEAAEEIEEKVEETLED